MNHPQALLRYFGGAVSRIVVTCYADVHVHVTSDEAQIVTSGSSPYILLSNHRSMFDIPLGLHLFSKLRIRPLIFVSARFINSVPGLRRIPWEQFDVLRVERGEAGREQAVGLALEALRDGTCVAIMPEGRVRREADPQDGAIGTSAASIATFSRAPIVIVCGAGSEDVWTGGNFGDLVSGGRKRVDLVVGTVIYPDADVNRLQGEIEASLRRVESEARTIQTLHLEDR